MSNKNASDLRLTGPRKVGGGLWGGFSRDKHSDSRQFVISAHIRLNVEINEQTQRGMAKNFENNRCSAGTHANYEPTT